MSSSPEHPILVPGALTRTEARTRRVRLRLSRPLRAFLLALAAVHLAVAGLYVGLRSSGPATHASPLGSVSIAAAPARHGGLDAYVPLADWGVRASVFRAPVVLHVEPRRLDRDALMRTASGDQALLVQTRRDVQHAARAAALRAAAWALGGALVAGLLGALLLAAVGRPRVRTLVALPAATVLCAAAVTGAVAWRMDTTFDPDALDRPTFYARGAEVVQLLDAAEHARAAGDGYQSKVEGTLRGFASLLADPTQGVMGARGRALLASDLHGNTLALDAIGGYAEGVPVFFAGDIGNTGGAQETRTLAPRLARLGSRLVAVSGNHDSSRLMRRLAARGAIVLTSTGRLRADGTTDGHPLQRVAGLTVAGFDDPLEWHGADPGDPRRVFSFAERPDGAAEEAAAEARIVTWFDALPDRPDVVMVHENGLAQHLAQTIAARHDTEPLTILTGHDHRQHVDRRGSAVVVDAGTVGASGIYGVGKDTVGIGRLHFGRHGALEGVDLVSIEPVSGMAQAQRLVLDRARCPGDRDSCTLSAGEAAAAPPARG